jgi:broad specificity phosphatase PhoE
LTKLLREFDGGDREDLPVGTSLAEAHHIKSKEAGVVLAMRPGEGKGELIARAHAFVQHVLAAAAEGSSESEVLVVSHGGFIRTLLVYLLDRSVDTVLNTSVSVVRLMPKGASSRDKGIKFDATAESLNDISHLPENIATTKSAW